MKPGGALYYCAAGMQSCMVFELLIEGRGYEITYFLGVDGVFFFCEMYYDRRAYYTIDMILQQ